MKILSMVNFAIEHFGPVGKSCIRLNKLTVIVGANNSGKSYLATLIYALFQSIPGRHFGSEQFVYDSRPGIQMRLSGPFGRGPSKAVSALFSQPASLKLLQVLSKKLKKKQRIRFRDFDTATQLLFKEALKLRMSELSTEVGSELSRCFGVGLDELCRKPRNRKSFKINISGSTSKWEIEMRQQGGKFSMALIEASFDACVINPENFWLMQLRLFGKKGGDDELVMYALTVVNSMEAFLFKDFEHNSFYLPAARSGILQSHKALTSFVMRQASFAGIEKLDIPRMTGIVIDFINNIMALESRRIGPFGKLSSELEKDVLNGSIGLSAAKFGNPEITYKRDGIDFPLHSTSSMISELAPVVLYLRHLVSKGDLLIIEEPEAHLHPNAQRMFARLIPHLINSGVKILLTTHSDYFLGQLNNFIRLASVPQEWAAKSGYKTEDILQPADVSAYLCGVNDHSTGTKTKEIEVTSADGISDSVFATIIEDLYQESVILERHLKNRD